MNSVSPSIQLTEISKSFEQAGIVSEVLRDVSLEVQAGQFVALVGPSGCGKSTLLRMIARLQGPDHGAISCLDADSAEVNAQIGYVFQDATLLPWRSVLENVFLPLELKGERQAEWQEPLESILALVGLRGTDLQKTPAMLSGGMRMRVSLARALLNQPSVFLLDEPFASLDDILREQLNEELLKIWLDRRCTTVFVTHNIHEAVFLSQRVLVMSRNPGRIMESIDVPFPYPRSAELRSTPDFVRLTAQIRTALGGVPTHD